MSKYTLSFKKNDVFLELVTEDKKFISNEIECWIKAVSVKKSDINPVNLLQETYEDAKKSFEETSKPKIKEAEKLPEPETTTVTPKIKIKQEETVEKKPVKADFSELLDEKINSPVKILEDKAETEPDSKSFNQMINIKNPKSLLDYLLIAANYLHDVETIDRFSLKQINAKVISVNSKPVDHSVVQKAVTLNLIEIVPDFTGMADVTEYTITPEGKEYFKMKSVKKVAVAMSGGVDSSVAALLLKQQGYEVIGVTGKMQNNAAFERVAQNAKVIAGAIGIEHHSVDLSKEFESKVITYFEESYKNGYTPNPCAVCNKYIKWGALKEYIKNNIDAEYYATGHYAEIRNEDGNYKLYKAKDDKKDQIYMLFDLKQEDLAKTIFPLAGYTKEQIREIAKENNLPCAASKDSQDICFIPKPDSTKNYLIRTFGEKTGDIININTNKVMGKHNGFYQYTIGQRKGIGVAAEKPLYVVKLDAEKNIVYVGYKENLEQSVVNISNVNWQQKEYQDKEFNALVKIRYNTDAKPALIKPANLSVIASEAHSSSIPSTTLRTGSIRNSLFFANDSSKQSKESLCNCNEADKVQIILEKPESGISPGQACVIYDIDNDNNMFLIGGGWIN